MSHLRHLHPGETLRGYPSDAHNAFYDTKVKVDQMPGPANGPGGSSSVRKIICLIYNETGASIDVDRPVLELDGPVYTPDDNDQTIFREPEFNGITPTSTTAQIAIVIGPIADAPTARAAVLVGPEWVDVEFTDDTHTFAAIKVGDNTQLESASAGIPIIYHPEIPEPEYLPATLRCLVMLGTTASSGSQFLRKAVVIEEAGASTHSSEGITPGTVGRCVLLDGDGAKIDPGEYDEDAIEVVSSHEVPLQVDKIIWIESAEPIVAGSVWELDEYGEGTLSRVWGHYVNAWDEIKAHSTYVAGNLQSIGHDAAAEPEWQDDDEDFECPEAT